MRTLRRVKKTLCPRREAVLPLFAMQRSFRKNSATFGFGVLYCAYAFCSSMLPMLTSFSVASIPSTVRVT